MRIVHTADWHIGKIINDYSLLEDQKYYFECFINELKEIKPDALLISGDLYDRSIPSAEAISLLNNILCEIVLELKIKTFIIAGNHDSKERLAFAGDLLEKSGLYISGNITEKIKKVSFDKENNKINIFMLPYIEPHNVKMIFPECNSKTHNDTIEFYFNNAFEKINKDELNILMAHGTFLYLKNKAIIKEEISVGGSDMIDASIFKDFDYVALGHIHSNKNIGDKKMQYSGSPLKYSIDEFSQQKTFTIIDFSEEKNPTFTYKKIKPLRDLRIIEGSFDYISDRNNHENLDDYVFANITDEKVTLHAISILKSVFPNILGLKYINLSNKSIDEKIQSVSCVKQKSEVELFASFYENVCETPLSEQETNYISNIIYTLKGEENDSY